MALAMRILSTSLKYLEVAIVKASKLCHRAVGPILIEWLFLRLPAGALVVSRFLLRSISYASVQRVMATSIALIVLIIFYFLRV